MICIWTKTLYKIPCKINHSIIQRTNRLETHSKGLNESKNLHWLKGEKSRRRGAETTICYLLKRPALTTISFR